MHRLNGNVCTKTIIKRLITQAFSLATLCPQCKPLHAVLHDTDRPFSETDRLSIPLAQCPGSLEPGIQRRLTWRYCYSRSRSSPRSSTASRCGHIIYEPSMKPQ